MNFSALTQDLEQALADLPVFDVHTHLVGRRQSVADLTSKLDGRG